MKTRLIIIAVLLTLILCTFCSLSQSQDLTLNNTPVKVCFSPNSGCTEAITKEINNAKTDILVQAYSFTSTPIAKAMLYAHKRGVKVEAILDKSQRQERYTSATFLVNTGIPTYIDAQHAIAHNKIMIIDKETVITGSFNFTRAAEEKVDIPGHINHLLSRQLITPAQGSIFFEGSRMIFRKPSESG